MNRGPLYHPRLLERRIAEAMADTPVVVIAGPRQSGKTTLVKRMTGESFAYLSLDDAVTRLAAKEDPVGLLRGKDRAVIDEVQRAPGLLSATKQDVDKERQPGRFLLTGSANLMVLPTITESLAGRAEILHLLPLSQSELRGNSANWIGAVFSRTVPTPAVPAVGDDLVEIVLSGGHPEAVRRFSPRRRTSWLTQYVDALVQRDIRDIADVARLSHTRAFVRALALTSGQLCNYSALGAKVAIDHKSAVRYVGVLENMFLLRRLRPYSSNKLKRMVKTPKLHFLDSGLLCALIGLNADTVKMDRDRFACALASFVYSELHKHATFADDDYKLFFYRDRDKAECDFIIESSRGEIVAVEVKAAATVHEHDLRTLRRICSAAGSAWAGGVILYDGHETYSLGSGIWAAPISRRIRLVPPGAEREPGGLSTRRWIPVSTTNPSTGYSARLLRISLSTLFDLLSSHVIFPRRPQVGSSVPQAAPVHS